MLMKYGNGHSFIVAEEESRNRLRFPHLQSNPPNLFTHFINKSPFSFEP